LLAGIALAPLLFVLARGGAARDRRDAALALHRAQLIELDRDLADGRIGAPEHATAVLEVKRRLLAVADVAEAAPARSSLVPVLVALVAIPAAAAGLYAIHGRPSLPDAPLAPRLEESQQSAQRDETLISTLRQRLSQMDPSTDMARQGYVLLGNAESGRGHLAEAAAAWQVAIDGRFDPTLAVEIAEARSIIEGRVSEASAALFRRALAEGPAEAPWRELANKRLAEARVGAGG
jgi:cytochrome c-type biogenesis protein CcmH